MLERWRPVGGLNFIDTLKLFEADPDTDAVLMIGEIGGNAEVDAGRWIKENTTSCCELYCWCLPSKE